MVIMSLNQIYIFLLAAFCTINSKSVSDSVYNKIKSSGNGEEYKCTYLRTTNLIEPEPPYLKTCSSYSVIKELTALQQGKDVDDAVCLLYYNNFQHLCRVMTPVPGNIDKLLFNITKILEANSNVTDICSTLKNSTYVEESAKPGIQTILENIKDGNKCARLCSYFDGTVKPVCTLAAFMGKTSTQLNPKTSSIPVVNDEKLSTGEAKVADVKPNLAIPENNIAQHTNKFKTVDIFTAQPNENLDIIDLKNSPESSIKENAVIKHNEQPYKKVTIGSDKNKLMENQQSVLKVNKNEQENIQETNSDVNSNSGKPQEHIDSKAIDVDDAKKPKENPQVEQTITKSAQEETNKKQEKPANGAQLEATPNKLDPNAIPNKQENKLVTKVDGAPDGAAESPPDPSFQDELAMDEMHDGDVDYATANEALQPKSSEVKTKLDKYKPLETDEDDLNSAANYQNQNIDDSDSYFFAYFMMVCIMFICGYVAYHNKQKILALVVEGRQGRRTSRTRRPNSANYRKLDSNLEEAVTSSCNKNASTPVIY